MVVKDFVNFMIKKGRSPEEIKEALSRHGYRASLPALRSYVKKNPVVPIPNQLLEDVLKVIIAYITKDSDPSVAIRLMEQAFPVGSFKPKSVVVSHSNGIPGFFFPLKKSYLPKSLRSLIGFKQLLMVFTLKRGPNLPLAFTKPSNNRIVVLMPDIKYLKQKEIDYDEAVRLFKYYQELAYHELVHVMQMMALPKDVDYSKSPDLVTSFMKYGRSTKGIGIINSRMDDPSEQKAYLTTLHQLADNYIDQGLSIDKFMEEAKRFIFSVFTDEGMRKKSLKDAYSLFTRLELENKTSIGKNPFVKKPVSNLLEQEIIKLYTVYGFTVEEISDIIKIRPHRVSSILKKHKIELRNYHKEVPLDENLIRHLHDKGYNPNEIASRLRVSIQTIHNRLEKMGLNTSVSAESNLDNQKIILMYKQGMTSKEIAKAEGVSNNTILRRLKKLGIEIRPASRRVRETDLKDIINLYQNGTPSTEISKILGISRDYVLKRLRDAGVTIRNKGFSEKPLNIEDIIKLKSLGYSVDNIAKHFGVNRKTISSRLKKYYPKNNPHKPPANPPKILSKEAREKFLELARLQRGTPERKMEIAQLLMGGGVLSHAIEHIGDIIHRMTEDPEQAGAGAMGKSAKYYFDYMRPGPQSLRHGVGWFFETDIPFIVEHRENLKNNYKSLQKYPTHPASKMTWEEFNEAVNKALLDYSNAHAALPVYNIAQFWAREAAVALGRQNFAKTHYYLNKIRQYKDKPRDWRELASQYDPNFEAKVKKNPTCKRAGMSAAKRKAYNQQHGSNVKKGVTNITSMEKLRRWGAWATRFYGRKDRPALVKGKYFTPLSCSAIAWGVNPPPNWREAEKIYRRGKEALDTYKTLRDKYGYSPKQKFTTKERNFLNREFLHFVK